MTLFNKNIAPGCPTKVKTIFAPFPLNLTNKQHKKFKIKMECIKKARQITRPTNYNQVKNAKYQNC